MNKELWKRCVEFHGHECSGLAIGFRACEIASKKLNLNFSKDEEIVCITENDACGVDAVQVITGCTMGKGNLIFKDRGKMAFSFIKRGTGEGIRVILKPTNREMSREERQKYILEAPIDDVFEIKPVNMPLPEKARIFNSIICAECGESTAEHRIRIQNGKMVCLDCFREYTRGW
ncbi:FmdE family protein [Caloramator sp. mosi_1]|uniref:FmdE family protein n=1 Tax=Caloramator sp. mosi_1 TaxID=3023090 RepID=UPI0023620BFB|nr:FmdE family protein [Caloramator sp. mosi_1]WDC84836.1 FmdE family protein [Caloramator sp. mosi_1]